MNGSEAAPSPTCRGLFGPERVGEGEVSDTFSSENVLFSTAILLILSCDSILLSILFCPLLFLAHGRTFPSSLRDARIDIGVTPYDQTTSEVNTLHLESKPF